MVSDEMIIDLNVFGLLTKNFIMCNLKKIPLITVHDSGGRQLPPIERAH